MVALFSQILLDAIMCDSVLALKHIKRDMTCNTTASASTVKC